GSAAHVRACSLHSCPVYSLPPYRPSYPTSDAPLLFFLFTHTAPTEIYTLSLHDALPILSLRHRLAGARRAEPRVVRRAALARRGARQSGDRARGRARARARRGLLRPLGGRRADAHRRRHARLPLPPAPHRHRRRREALAARRLHRHRPRRRGGHGAVGARAGAGGARPRLRAGRARARCLGRTPRVAPYPAQRARPGDHRGDARRRRRHHGGGGAVVPRAGRAATHPVVGGDGGGGTRLAARGTLGVALSGARDRRRRDGTERAGRRAARRARRAGMTDIAYHPTRLRALRDTFRALRAAEFPWTADTVYLNNASIGPIPERTRRALDEFTAKRTA